MQGSQPTDFATLRDFAQRWLKRPLTETEEQALQRFAESTASAPPPSRTTADPCAASLIDGERERVRGLIDTMRQSMLNTRSDLSAATQANEAAVLKAVDAAASLNDLRPGQLRAPQNGEGSGNQLVVAQIADRLANLVKREVQDTFDRQFATLAQQMQDVIDAARAQGLIADAPQTQEKSPPPPSAA